MNIQKQFDQITTPEIRQVLSEGLAEIYQNRPTLPVTYLAHWLNSYSQSQKTKKQLIENKKSKQERFNQIQTIKNKMKETEAQEKERQKQKILTNNKQFESKILSTKHLQDLLYQWLPQYVEKSFQLTGAYVGKLDFNKKPIEEGNFQVGVENDTQNPKTITYIGASISHKNLMIGQTLPNGKGVSYGIFEQKSEENNEQEGEQVNTSNKKNYISINNVLKQQNLHYFKYPKLGAYACFPLKIKSCLSFSSLDKAIVDYKAYLKTKEETQKEYNEKVAETRTEAEEALKKFQEFQINDDEPSSQEQKKTLQDQSKAADQKLQQILNQPPVIEEAQFQTIQREFFLAVDTLGQDRQISQENLQQISQKLQFFISQWEQKQRNMLLADVLTFLEEQTQLQNIQNFLSQHIKGVIHNHEAQIKEQFPNKEKQAEFELSLIKCEKTRQLLSEPIFKASMEVYMNYNVPKFTQLIQIWCMLLQMKKNEINLPQSNQLDHRKMINHASFKNLLEKLQKYPLRRQFSEAVSSEYKINKILERLEKIESQSLARYNAFLFALHSLLKNQCWARILCRDAKKELFEAKTKQKQIRDEEIQKWLSQIEKSLETSKAQLDEQGQQNFNEQEWRKNYELQNPKPEPLEQPFYLEFEDIE